MRVHALLSWFNESPHWLAACVASLGRVCDHVVAVDGRYALYQDEMAASPLEQSEAIVEAAGGAGLALTLHRPVEPFGGNEVEKRNLLLRLAQAHAGPEDWFLVIDGDCYISECSAAFRIDLAATGNLCAQIALQEHFDPYDADMPMRVAAANQIQETWKTPVVFLYRALPGLSYRGTHYSVAGEIGGETVWLWGHDDAVDPADLRDSLTIVHRNIDRTAYRRQQASAYYAVRERLEVEVRP